MLKLKKNKTQNHSNISRIAKAGMFIGTFLLLAACSEIDCPVTNGVLSNYVVQGQRLSDTLTISAIRSGQPDTVLLNRQTNSATFSLPMSYNKEADSLRFIFTDTLGRTTTDTLIVYKNNISHFESIDCSPTFFHTLTSVSAKGHRISQVEINNPNVDYDGTKENIYIRFTNN